MKLYTDAELAQILDKKIFHKIGEVADEMGVECYLVEIGRASCRERV